MPFDLVLAIETSCDDTSVALVNSSREVVGLRSVSQDDVHAPFGGVIPELACRNHTMKLLPLVNEVLSQAGVEWDSIDGIAVTVKPGLIGSLLVGVTTAKTLAFIYDKPLIGVNHIEGHIHAPFLKFGEYSPPADFDYPFVGLCVSGGHTSLYHVKSLGKYELIGRTLDDAAGEAFDKFGKQIGLGYPAGRHIDDLAKGGNVAAFDFPRAMMKKGDLNFSFSGLKTSGSMLVKKDPSIAESSKSDLCASYQEAIVDVLVEKLQRGVVAAGVKRVVVTGGVSANSRLRLRLEAWALAEGIVCLVPPIQLCTDNAAMIGLVGLLRLNIGERSKLTLSPEAYLKVSELV